MMGSGDRPRGLSRSTQSLVDEKLNDDMPGRRKEEPMTSDVRSSERPELEDHAGPPRGLSLPYYDGVKTRLWVLAFGRRLGRPIEPAGFC